MTKEQFIEQIKIASVDIHTGETNEGAAKIITAAMDYVADPKTIAAGLVLMTGDMEIIGEFARIEWPQVEA